MVALHNTAERHHMVVCTLCSCYPWPVLGLPPTWYKSAPYRSRAVKDPRGVLADFGVSLPDRTEIRVADSTAEVRYLVIPMRPRGTEGFSEEQLAATGDARFDDRHGPAAEPHADELRQPRRSGRPARPRPGRCPSPKASCSTPHGSRRYWR